MKDKFDELVEELNLENFGEDFEAKPAMYQVWMLGYDENKAITDFEVMVNEFHDAERAVDCAKRFVDEERYNDSKPFPKDVAYIEVLVETVVDLEDHTENVRTLFSATVKIN